MVSNGDVACETPSLPKMNFMELSGLAEQFVMQYYSVMNKCPDLLHRFYGNDSTLIYESSPICGQADIHNAFCKLNLNDTRTTILKIDALKAFQNSALVQVQFPFLILYLSGFWRNKCIEWSVSPLYAEFHPA